MVTLDVDRLAGPQKGSHLVASQLRKLIVHGTVAPGQLLPSESELMNTFQVSRETLREALSILESESLIRIKRGRSGGAQVLRPDGSAANRYGALLLQVRGARLGGIQEARQILECPAAAAAAVGPSATVIEKLIRLHAAEAADHETTLSAVDSVVAFDNAVVSLSGNRTLSTISGFLREAYAGELFNSRDSYGDEWGIIQRIIRWHAEFMDAVESEDASAASTIWADYLQGVDAQLLSRRGYEAAINVVPMWKARYGGGEGKGPRVARIAAVIATEIRSKIAIGELMEGDRLPPLPTIASEFGVSRPTLREALRILETEGLLSLRAGSRAGALIHHPTTRIASNLAGVVLESLETTMGDVWNARIQIEPPALVIATERMGAADLDELRAIYNRMEMAEDAAATAKEGLKFRFAALNAAHNIALTAAFEIIRWVAAGSLATVATTFSSLPMEIRGNRRVSPSYSALMEAFESKDSLLAADIWKGYLVSTVPALQSQLGARYISDVVDY